LKINVEYRESSPIYSTKEYCNTNMTHTHTHTHIYTLVQKMHIISVILGLLHRSSHRCGILHCRKCFIYYIDPPNCCNSCNILPRWNCNRCKCFKIKKAEPKLLACYYIG